MSIDTHIPRRSTQTLSLSVRNVLLRLGIPILLRHSKIYDMHDVRRFSSGSTYQEVVRLDISVNQVLVVYSLDSCKLKRHEKRKPRR